MKVKELIELLQKEDLERIVIIAKDAEGNSYSPLENTLGFGIGRYIAESTRSGDFQSEGSEGEPCLVLWPTN